MWLPFILASDHRGVGGHMTCKITTGYKATDIKLLSFNELCVLLTVSPFRLSNNMDFHVLIEM